VPNWPPAIWRMSAMGGKGTLPRMFQSAVVGSIVALTCEILLAGKPAVSASYKGAGACSLDSDVYIC
jgi:hypothetical protein